ncbi:MAG: GNAT family N-acetyltransferase, partial [Acidobacteriota bacterium]
MIDVRPIVLEGGGIRLEPLTAGHRAALAAAVEDGRLWDLWYTSVPTPEGVPAYLDTALAGQRDGHMLPWAVRDVASGAVVGCTRYHDIVAAIDRVEIGYTWY